MASIVNLSILLNSLKSPTSHNAAINNHYNSSIVSEQTLNNTMVEKNEIASTASIKMPSDASGTLATLDSYIEDVVFTCLSHIDNCTINQSR